MWFFDKGTVFVSLPGVPFEMESIIDNEVLPRLQEQFVLPSIFHKTILTYGLGESAIAERILDWENALPEDIKLAYLPSLGRVRLRLSSKGQDLSVLENRVNAQIEKVLPLIKDIYYGADEEKPIEVLIADQLTEKEMTLSCAESFTGGVIATRITSQAGASNYFKGSAVTYSESSKTKILNVSLDLIATHGVVSAEVVEAMAKGAKEVYKTDYAIATTGNAGPTQGDLDQEVGTVFIGLSTPNEVFSFKFSMGNSRIRVIQKSVNQAFEILYQELIKK
jgi:nicotinamide-nucleotide amidase